MPFSLEAVMQTFPWLVATYAPLEIAYLAIAWKIIGALHRSSLKQAKWLSGVAVIVAAALTSGIGVLAGQFWAILIEIIRVGDGHLGSRTQFIPYMQIQSRTFVFGVLLFFAAVAARSYVDHHKARRECHEQSLAVR